MLQMQCMCTPFSSGFVVHSRVSLKCRFLLLSIPLMSIHVLWKRYVLSLELSQPCKAKTGFKNHFHSKPLNIHSQCEDLHTVSNNGYMAQCRIPSLRYILSKTYVARSKCVKLAIFEKTNNFSRAMSTFFSVL